MISKLNDIKINMNELLFYLLKFKTYIKNKHYFMKYNSNCIYY